MSGTEKVTSALDGRSRASPNPAPASASARKRFSVAVAQAWSQNRNYIKFRKWFDVEIHSVMLDLGKDEVESD